MKKQPEIDVTVVPSGHVLTQDEMREILAILVANTAKQSEIRSKPSEIPTQPLEI